MSRSPRRTMGKLTLAKFAIYCILLVVFMLAFYPFFYTLFMAVMPYSEYVKKPVHVLPSGFTLDYFEQVLSNARLVRAFANSALRTFVGTISSIIVTMLTGYALSRKHLRGRRVMNFLFVVPMWVSGGMIPYYLTIRAVGLLNSFWAMIIPVLINSFNMFIARSYYADYPQEVIEAALVDGASQFGTFWRIIWPTSKPLFATLALLIGSFHWNDFFWPSILVSSEWQPAPVLLNSIMTNRTLLFGLGQGARIEPQSFISAVAAIQIIPLLIIYPFLQRHLVKGIMLGSVKG
ncbi:MAG: carbohydrate ABC transporter permease [Firmicutes bacterium]|nr:carbohydrate ABC transporter permease [Bacillota bacterium]